MKHTVRTVSVELDGLVCPGDTVLVHTDRYPGAARFHGRFQDGKLAVAVNYGAFQTYLHVLPAQVKRVESKGGNHV